MDWMQSFWNEGFAWSKMKISSNIRKSFETHAHVQMSSPSYFEWFSFEWRAHNSIRLVLRLKA